MSVVKGLMARRRHLAPDQDLVQVSTKCVAFLLRPEARTVYVIVIAIATDGELCSARVHAGCRRP